VSQLARQTPAEWGALARAQAELLVAQALVWVRPSGSLVETTAAAGPAEPDVRRPPNPLACKLAVSVQRAADYGVFRPKCLVRSLALTRLLHRHGIEGSRIRIGVRVVDRKLLAHAWVELDGRVLGDDPTHTAVFAQLTDVHVA
jgi:hypothetical protein